MKVHYAFTGEIRRICCVEKKILLILFGIPLLYSVLFGFTYSEDVVKYIPTVIYDQDQSVASRALIQAFADSERYLVVGVVTSQEEMENYMETEKAIVAVGIPDNFSKNIKAGHGADVLLEVNAVNLMYSNSVLNFSNEIIATYNAGTGQKLVEGLSQAPKQALWSVMPVQLRTRVLNNPTNSYSCFMLPGMVANGVQIGIILCVCTALSREYRNLKIWRGTSSAVIVLGKLFSFWLCAIIAAILSSLLIIIFFHVPFQGGWGALLLIYGAFTFAVVNIGIFFSAVIQDEMQAIKNLLLYIMPAFLYSGYSWPREGTSGFNYVYSSVMPLSYAVEVIRDIFLAGYSPDLWCNTIILLISGSCLLFLTVKIFSQQRKKIGLQAEGPMS